MKIHLVSSDFYDLLSDSACMLQLGMSDELSCYMVSILSRHCVQVGLSDRVLGMAYLEASNKVLYDLHPMRQVAETGLIMAGLYPEKAARLKVSPLYYAHLSMAAYDVLLRCACHQEPNMQGFYAEIHQEFIVALRILFNIRCMQSTAKEHLLMQMNSSLQAPCYQSVLKCYSDNDTFFKL